MGRKKAREWAFKIIYAMDMGKNTLQDAASIAVPRSIDENQRQFIIDRANGVMRNLKKIDKIINKHSSEWNVERMASTDRNILRLAVYEMLFCEDTPLKVSINEAIELSKKYCSDKSYKFINGILGSVIEKMQ